MKRTENPLSAALVGSLVLGCGQAPDQPEITPRAAALHENQGTDLTGTERARFAVSYDGARDAAGVPFTSLGVRKGSLVAVQGGAVHQGDSDKLVGARLVGPANTVVEIVRACPHPRTPQGWKPPLGWTPPAGCAYPADWTIQPDEFEYEVMVIDNGARTPLCKGGWNRAVPMLGTFDALGNHPASTTHFTLACNSGVAVKCSNWGYKPWVHADRHLACTRMARADYCGDGRSHTFEGTSVDVYDSVGILAPVTGLAHFEAAWTPRGALCLSQLRWQTLPPDGYCASTLPDPRYSAARFCDDFSRDELERLGSLIFNHSGEYERGLQNWVRGADSMISSTGFYGGAKATTPPEPGFTQVAFEGIAFSSYLTGTTLLRTFRDPVTGDSLTTTGTPPAEYSALVREEGYVYPVGAALPETAVPLMLYRSGTDHLTTTLPPPAGYSAVRLEGYLPVRP